MLHLPENWPSFSAGALAGHVLDQLSTRPAQRKRIGHLLTGAALDLTCETRWRRARPELALDEPAEGLWTFGEAAFVYFGTINTKAIEHCVRLVMWSINLQVIVPAEHGMILRLTLDTSIGRLRPVIYTIDDFINSRTTAATVDARLTYREAVMQLIEYYNRRALAENGSHSLRIDAPWM